MKAKKALAVGMSALTLAGSLAYAPSARADEVSPSGKGIIGGALLGDEVVVITMSLVGVKNGWAYLGGGLAGAAAGGVGGYFVEQGSSDGRAPVYMLAGGLALIIPAVVLTLNATSYQGNENATEDKAPTNVPAADPGNAGGSAVIGGPAPAPSAPAPSTPPSTPAPAPATPPPSGGGGGAPQAPQSMLDVRSPSASARGNGPTQLRLGVPVPEVRNVFSTQERVKFGANQASEVRLPIVRVTF